MVHYYSGSGEAHPLVNIYCDGHRIATYGQAPTNRLAQAIHVANSSDTYIEKETSINEEIDRMRLSATRSLFERRDVLIVASVSCIYGLGSPEAYFGMLQLFEKDVEQPMEEVLRQLAKMQYERTHLDLAPGSFRLRGDTLEVYPPYDDTAVRVSFWGDEVERIEVLRGPASVQYGSDAIGGVVQIFTRQGRF